MKSRFLCDISYGRYPIGSFFSQLDQSLWWMRLLWKGKVKKYNVRIWRSENSCETKAVSRESEKAQFWCAISFNGVIRQYYFDEPKFQWRQYLHLLNIHFLSMLRKLPQSMIFQQGRAPPHHIRAVRHLLNANLSNSRFGKAGKTNWPVCFPDLTPCDFFQNMIKKKSTDSSVLV